MDANDAEWMTIPEAAARFDVGIATVRTWVRRGLLPVDRWRVRGEQGAPRVWVRRADARAFAERYYVAKPRPAWLDEDV